MAGTLLSEIQSKHTGRFEPRLTFDELYKYVRKWSEDKEGKKRGFNPEKKKLTLLEVGRETAARFFPQRVVVSYSRVYQNYIDKQNTKHKTNTKHHRTM